MTRRFAFAALLLFVGSLAIYWPGVVTYDGVQQYAEAISGRYDDWHPPIMARLWALLLPLGGQGGADARHATGALLVRTGADCGGGGAR